MGPPASGIHRRVIRSPATGGIIDDCVIDDVPDQVLNRPLEKPTDMQVQVTMKGAMEMYQTKGAHVSEVYSQPSIVQEDAIQGKSKPGWSLVLTMNYPDSGKPWDLGKRDVRARVKRLIRETRPFMLIGSPPFSSLQNRSKNGRNTKEFAEKLKVAKKHFRFCAEV